MTKSAIERVIEWITIDWAAKDGTPILGADFHNYPERGGRPTRIWWQPEFDAWISGARVMTMASGYTVDGKTEKMHSPEIFRPTHFMHLPSVDVGALAPLAPVDEAHGLNPNPSLEREEI